MVKDGQVKRLWKLLLAKKPLELAALRCGMDAKTARKYRDSDILPSETPVTRNWRTRHDPFEDVWSEVEEQLEQAHDLQAKTLFEWLQGKYPGRFAEGQKRTLERRVKAWRATRGPAKEVFFSQVHVPGRLCASDFTHMTELEVTIGRQSFPHLVYHFVLTYSNWESITLCFSESFESLSAGLQAALWELGGVPVRHRTDRLSAAVNNLSEAEEFTQRYRSLLGHYDLSMERIQAGKGNENGDVESSHRHFKDVVNQALLLRGSREFESRESYGRFLQELVSRRNAGRQERLEEELKVLRPLPPQRWDHCRRLEVTVSSGSLIRVDRNLYSVDSRLIGERVEVRMHVEHLEIWYGQKLLETLPRLRGRDKHRINYRHVIDWLIRKPGAFADYRYREDLFPTSRFRMAYDALREEHPSRAEREYLKILHLAAKESESAVDEGLRCLLAGASPLSFELVEEFVGREPKVPAVTEVSVELTDLASFDELFTDREVCDGDDSGRCECELDWLSEGIAFTHVSGDVRGAGSACGTGDVELRAVLAGTGASGM
jgi:hypothetical protein